jgi:heterodisulfide reductase subunit A
LEQNLGSDGKRVLVIGGGISGLTAALDLARMGYPVSVAERAETLGGLSASFCCKASETCNKCFACVVDKRVKDALNQGAIEILTGVEPVGFRGGPGNYVTTLRRGRQPLEILSAAVVVAAGIAPYDAAEKVEYGYGRFRNVITARDLDEMLRFRGGLTRPSDGRVPATVAFFQCVGSRDETIGHLYCSQACCAYALRLIRVLRHQVPDLRATFLYMDIQPAGASFQGLLEASRQDNHLRLIRSLPSKVYHSPLHDTLRVRLVDPGQGDVVEEAFDLIVLSTGMVLRPETRPLIDLLGLALDEDGFVASPAPETGLFVAGACAGPKDIDRSITHAGATASRVALFLKGGR